MTDKDYYKNLILYLNNEIDTAIKCLEALKQQTDALYKADCKPEPKDEHLNIMEL